MPPNQDEPICIRGDVMTGKGVDQVLPHPGDPLLHEPSVHDARVMAVRGFALTNDSVFLDPYLRSKDKIQTTFAELKKQLAGSSEQKNNVVILEQLLDESIKYLNKVIYARINKGLQEAGNLIAIAEGKNITDRIRAVTAKMKEIETSILNSRASYENEAAGKTITMLLVFTFVPFGLLVFIYVILRRNIMSITE